MPDPFYAADFRHWQLIQPNEARLNRLGCKVLALEKKRPHVPLERAIMAIRFSPEWVGVQFHPEADPDGMLYHFSREEKKKSLIEKKGVQKYEAMIEKIKDPEKLPITHKTILPGFIDNSIKKIKERRIASSPQ